MQGVFTALITPFTPEGKLDLSSYRRLLEKQRKAHVTGVIPCGTTGESPTLRVEEKKTLILTALEELSGSSVKVIAGTGSHNTAETVEFSKWASDQGVAGVLVVTPYYNKPSQKGLEAHFLAVAEAVQCEIIVYNVPGRTGVSLSAPTIVSLARHSRIQSLKEATGNVAFTSEILDLLSTTSEKMDLLSGDDATFLPLLAVGAKGVVSVASNLIPSTMVTIYTAFINGDLSQARDTHQRFYPLFRDLFLEANPVPVKKALALLGYATDFVRLPLVPLSQVHTEDLKKTLLRCGLTSGSFL